MNAFDPHINLSLRLKITAFDPHINLSLRLKLTSFNPHINLSLNTMSTIIQQAQQSRTCRTQAE